MKKLCYLCVTVVLMMAVMSPGLAQTDREPVTITMLSLPANVSGTMEGTWWTDYLYDELGITVELIPGSSDTTKLAALMAADALPDMVIFHSTSQVKDCIEAGMLVALDDYFDKMPNVTKYMSKAMAYYADTLSLDGKNYVIPNSVGPKPKDSLAYWNPSIRWDLYKKIGSPEIKTVWDYLDVLKQMQEIYPVNEDGQKVYAITAWTDWDPIYMYNALQPSMHNGITCGDQLPLPFAEVDFDTLELSCTLDENSAYIDGLKWHFTANQMGILDPDCMTQNWNTVLEKASAGRVLFGWYDWTVSGYNTPERVNAEEPIGFATVLPTDTRAPIWGEDIVGRPWAWAISKNAKNIERCVEYLDFMCNPDKQFILYNGPKGETWDLNGEGKPYLTEKGLECAQDPTTVLSAGGMRKDGISVINSAPLCGGVVSPLYGATLSYEDWETYTPDRTNLEKDVAQATGYATIAEELLAKDTHTVLPPALGFTPPIPTEIQMLMNQIGDVVKNQSWLAVYAADEAEFNRIVSEMRQAAYDLGLEEVIEFNRKAWAEAVELAARYQ